MIITGNSNVDCLRRFGRPVAAGGEPVRVHWVGALHLGHFTRRLPLAEKVFQLFAGEPGWKLLSLGTHDVYALWHAAAAGRLEATLAAMLAGYGPVLSALAAPGKVGWLVFPDPLKGLTLPGLGDADKRAIARRFVAGMSALCAERGVAVIDAAEALAGPDGATDPRFLQEDGLHLDERGARAYLERVSAATGVALALEPRPALFSPRAEDESFYGLVVGNLGVPERRLPPRAELEAALCDFVGRRLRERGLDLEVVPATELVESGLLDSLGLVETWDFAAGAVGAELSFDVDLREHGTVEALAGALLARAAGQLAGGPGPAQADFFASVEAGRGDGEPERLRAAEAAIAAMSDATLASLEENVAVASEGTVCPYGLALYWVALARAARGDAARALALLDEAESPRRRYPVPADRVRPCRERWRAERAAAPGQERAAPPDLARRRAALERAEALGAAGAAGAHDALVELERLLTAAPGDPHVLAAIGKVCLGMGRPDDARVFLERAAAGAPGDAAIDALRTRANGAVLARAGAALAGCPTPTPAPARIEAAEPPPREEVLVPAGRQATPRVSALVSTYNSERFLRGCLEDLEAQTIAPELEIIVIDSCSQQGERAIVEEFQRRYDNIVYVRTDRRERLYAAWNRGIRLARGAYVTNTNTDDRRLPRALELEARALDRFPGVGLVYGDIWGTAIENDVLRPEEAERYRRYTYPEFTPLNGLTGSNFSPQPMWRRSAHDRVGWFDDGYVVAGDYDFFYRLSVALGAVHVRGPLGLYLENPSGIEKSQPGRTRQEFSRLRRRFYGELGLDGLFPALASHPGDEARGAAAVEAGNNCLRATLAPEVELACRYYDEARRLLGDRPELTHDEAVAALLGGDGAAALRALRRNADRWPASRALLEAAQRGGGSVGPGDLQLCGFRHPVVEAARRGFFVEVAALASAGKHRRTAERRARAGRGAPRRA